ncbi:DUF523 domain-containing protein [Thiobacillus sp.]|uniref:DUF523 domain-containing protein n=1 Tax=Thiobacillus sp. TaxID=924 RepID=UPI0025DF2B1B|nr:DUF523 domain-containing protein [Thiobacillus sp.]
MRRCGSGAREGGVDRDKDPRARGEVEIPVRSRFNGCMESVLVSACLLGEAVRYNGGDMRCDHDILRQWQREGRVVAVCPEVAGGLPVPRPRAEIAEGAGGLKVLAGIAKAVDSNGRDVSAYLISGAEQALELARARHIRIAVLKEGSPSCGTGFIFDGTFTDTRVKDRGVTATILQQAGVHVFSEAQLAEADALLRKIETDNVA